LILLVSVVIMLLKVSVLGKPCIVVPAPPRVSLQVPRCRVVVVPPYGPRWLAGLNGGRPR